MEEMEHMYQEIYDIAMSIGNHIEMARMCDEVASVTRRVLGVDAYAIICEKRVRNDKYVFNDVYLSPESFGTSEEYDRLLASIPQNRGRQEKNDFYEQLPLQVEVRDGGVWHLMHLPGFGLLAIFREQGALAEDTLAGLMTLNRKLAMACYACREHTHLETSERRYKLVVEAMAEGVAVLDLQERMRYVNGGLCTLLRKSRGDLMTQTVTDFLDDPNIGVFAKTMKTCLDEGSTQSEVIWILPDGGRLETLTSLTPSISDVGELTGYTLVVTDLTMQKRAERQSAQVQKMKAIGTLAGGIAHDFNNMLAVIMGSISYSLTRTEHDDEVLELLNGANTAAAQAQRLTNQLLTFAKGGAPITETSDINLILKESTELSLRGSKVACEYDLCNDVPAVDVDAGQMNQVISNLVLNASHAMPQGGALRVSTSVEEFDDQNHLSLPASSYVRIVVEDRGTGISSEHLERVFDPFFSTKEDGNGLGLATTYSIVQRHHGAITVDSEMGRGTSFCIYLPASSKPVVSSAPECGHTHSGSGRILLMDDNEMILRVFGTVLEKMGYEVARVNEGLDALAIYQEAVANDKPFKLVILDLTMPGGLGGAEVLKELLKINPEIKAIAASGYSNDPVMANHEKYGFRGVLPKPFGVDGLAKALNAILC